MDAPRLHITLRFLGEQDPERVGPIAEALKRAARVPAFHTMLEGWGTFGRPPRVWWIAAQGAGLGALKQAVDGELERIGFAPESRTFKGHITVGRRKPGRASGGMGPRRSDESNGRRYGRERPRVDLDLSGLGFRVDRVCLVRSELARGGPRYTSEYVAQLGGMEE